MKNRSFTAAVWATLIVGLAMFAAGGAVMAGSIGPQPPKAIKGEQCVTPKSDIRRYHMQYLDHHRDDTVHEGVRTEKFSLKGCVTCHAVKSEAAMSAASTAVPMKAPVAKKETKKKGAGKSTKKSASKDKAAEDKMASEAKTMPAVNPFITVKDPKHFCRVCHDYTAVKMDCFDCHASRPDAESAAALLAPATGKKAAAQSTREIAALKKYVKGNRK